MLSSLFPACFVGSVVPHTPGGENGCLYCAGTAQLLCPVVPRPLVAMPMVLGAMVPGAVVTLPMVTMPVVTVLVVLRPVVPVPVVPVCVVPMSLVTLPMVIVPVVSVPMVTMPVVPMSMVPVPRQCQSLAMASGRGAAPRWAVAAGLAWCGSSGSAVPRRGAGFQGCRRTCPRGLRHRVPAGLVLRHMVPVQ